MKPLKNRFFNSGHCLTFERLILQSGRMKIVRCPASFCLIEHPDIGTILYDTGYSPHVMEGTARWPYRLYRWLTPMRFTPQQSAHQQLQALAIAPETIKMIIISHLHADHVGGLRDFPNAQFIYLSEGYNAVKGLTGLKALKNAFLPNLIPDDFEERSLPLDKGTPKAPLPYHQFPEGYDIVGDGSLIGIPLPGHAPGLLGLLFHSEDGHKFFLVGDACWHRSNLIDGQEPHVAVRRLLNHDKNYIATLNRLRSLNREHPEITIIPTHWPETLKMLLRGQK